MEFHHTFPILSPKQRSNVKFLNPGCTVGHNVVIAMAGIAKVFAGEVIENALDYKDELEDEGPIKPKHIREAAR